MDLAPTVRAHLGPLEAYLDDPGVTEVLVSRPDLIQVQRQEAESLEEEIDLNEAALRAMVDRLARALGYKRPEDHLLAEGVLVPGWVLHIAGGPKGVQIPVVRFKRLPEKAPSLEGVHAEDWQLEQLTWAIENNQSLVVCGPDEEAKGELLAALANACAGSRTILIKSSAGSLFHWYQGPICISGSLGVPAALGLAAETILIDAPSALHWAQLLTSGRFFMVSLSGDSADRCLERAKALALAGDSGLSISAADSLLQSMVGYFIEMQPGEEGLVIQGLYQVQRTPQGIELSPAMGSAIVPQDGGDWEPEPDSKALGWAEAEMSAQQDHIAQPQEAEPQPPTGNIEISSSQRPLRIKNAVTMQLDTNKPLEIQPESLLSESVITRMQDLDSSDGDLLPPEDENYLEEAPPSERSATVLGIPPNTGPEDQQALGDMVGPTGHDADADEGPFSQHDPLLDSAALGQVRARSLAPRNRAETHHSQPPASQQLEHALEGSLSLPHEQLFPGEEEDPFGDEQTPPAALLDDVEDEVPSEPEPIAQPPARAKRRRPMRRR